MTLFLGNSRQHQPVCAKTISFWVRKVLCVAKAHMSLGSLWGVVASAALAAGVSLVTILQVGDWTRVFTPARHYFLYLHYYYGSDTRTLCSMQCWASVSRSSPGKCQTLLGCWAIALPSTKQIVSQLSVWYQH